MPELRPSQIGVGDPGERGVTVEPVIVVNRKNGTFLKIKIKICTRY